MMTIKLDSDALRYIAALEKTTQVEVKDCIVNEDKITYVVKEGQLGAAIGKGGVNVKRLSTKLGKKLHLVELNSDPLKFTENLVGKNIAKNICIKEENKTNSEIIKKILIEVDTKNRGSILGKNRENLETIKDLLKRHHNIEDVIVR